MDVIALSLILGMVAAKPFDPVVVLTPRPAEVSSTGEPQVLLNGVWQFHANPGKALLEPLSVAGSWQAISVPGHWLMQGFEVPQNVAAGYRRSFSIPKDWAGRRIKLRFDGVYSDAEVFVNGQAVGHHVGGFTPFEFDVTDVVGLDRKNSLALAVKRESPADLEMTTFGTLYAKTPLGGITRKVTLFAVPNIHVSQLHLHTTFGSDYGDAVLHVTVAVTNESQFPAADIRAAITLQGPNGRNVPIAPHEIDFGDLQPGQSISRRVQVAVASPAKWDCEHPNLYTLTCRLQEAAGHQDQETVQQRFGFRQIEVRGKRLLVNGQPAKLRGVCRHEMDAITGRVNAPALSHRDVELFREANINLIRTSHYPPAEELLNACDELGMFVEEEAPFHHAQPIVTPEYRDLFLQQAAEMIERDRNRPSVIIWSLGNESDWSPNFAASAQMVGRLDPSRPRIFAEGYGHFTNYPKDDIYHSLEIASWHYPGMATIDERSRATQKPLLFDEYCHGNCYNREEIATDPGLRDQWEACLEEIWERMQANEGCLGGAIWGGIDEVWNLPDGTERGWGRWGLLDSYHRPKPEYWHTKKVYSPIRIRSVKLPKPKSEMPIQVEVENRHDFTNLSELQIDWTLGDQTGKATTDAAPHTTATLEIQPNNLPKAGDCFRIEFHSPRGFLIDVFQQAVLERESTPTDNATETQYEKLRLTQDNRRIIVENSRYSWTFDRASGMLHSVCADAREVATDGPTLMLLPIGANTSNQTHREGITPWTATCTNWRTTSVTATEIDSGVEVHVEGQYQEAKGSFRIRLSSDGAFTIDYHFVCQKNIEARQVGIVLDLPERCDRLSWQRDVRWTVYPEDHIGRPAGNTTSTRDARWPASAPDGRPTWPWAYDETPLGTNDFRATRTGIRHVALADETGCGLDVVSDGTQAARAWLDGDRVRLLLADFSRGTGERFLRTRDFAAAKALTLKPGQAVEGTVCGFLTISRIIDTL